MGGAATYDDAPDLITNEIVVVDGQGSPSAIPGQLYNSIIDQLNRFPCP